MGAPVLRGGAGDQKEEEHLGSQLVPPGVDAGMALHGEMEQVNSTHRSSRCQAVRSIRF